MPAHPIEQPNAGSEPTNCICLDNRALRVSRETTTTATLTLENNRTMLWHMVPEGDVPFTVWPQNDWARNGGAGPASDSFPPKTTNQTYGLRWFNGQLFNHTSGRVIMDLRAQGGQGKTLAFALQAPKGFKGATNIMVRTNFAAGAQPTSSFRAPCFTTEDPTTGPLCQACTTGNIVEGCFGVNTSNPLTFIIPLAVVAGILFLVRSFRLFV